MLRDEGLESLDSLLKKWFFLSKGQLFNQPKLKYIVKSIYLWDHEPS